MLVYTITILFLTLVGGIWALYSFIKKNAKKSTEPKNSLADHFNHGKALNRELIKKVQDYTEKHQAYEKHFMEDLTFQKCLNHLKKINNEFFNEENEAMVKNENYSKEYLEELNQQIQKQISRHIQINNSLEWYTQR